MECGERKCGSEAANGGEAAKLLEWEVLSSNMGGVTVGAKGLARDSKTSLPVIGAIFSVVAGVGSKPIAAMFCCLAASSVCFFKAAGVTFSPQHEHHTLRAIMNVTQVRESVV
jgi:hypothetical protein